MTTLKTSLIDQTNIETKYLIFHKFRNIFIYADRNISLYIWMVFHINLLNDDYRDKTIKSVHLLFPFANEFLNNQGP